MQILVLLMMLVSAPVVFGYGQPEPAPAVSDSDARAEGQTLARELVAQRPQTNLAISGWLNIKSPGRESVRVRLRLEISVTASNWQAYYETSGGGRMNTMLLTVQHSAVETNVYNVYNINAPAEPGREAKPFAVVGGAGLMTGFAGSDLWLADLGLEFFHWPQQRLVKKEMSRGRSCRVLESINPQPATNGYSRVVSWIDRETSGIVYAEAYDAGGKKLKEFSPKEFTKVNGQWQLQEMEMRNVRTGSRSQIEFEPVTGQ